MLHHFGDQSFKGISLYTIIMHTEASSSTNYWSFLLLLFIQVEENIIQFWTAISQTKIITLF